MVGPQGNASLKEESCWIPQDSNLALVLQVPLWWALSLHLGLKSCWISPPIVDAEEQAVPLETHKEMLQEIPPTLLSDVISAFISNSNTQNLSSPNLSSNIWVLGGWSCGCGRDLSPEHSLCASGMSVTGASYPKEIPSWARFGSAFLSNRTTSSNLLPVSTVKDPWNKREGALCLLGAGPEWKWLLGNQRLQDDGQQRRQHHLPVHPLQQLCCHHGLLRCAGDTTQGGCIQYLDVEQILTHVKPGKNTVSQLSQVTDQAWYSRDVCSGSSKAEIILSAWTAFWSEVWGPPLTL